MSIFVSSNSQVVSNPKLEEPQKKELNAANSLSLAFDEIEQMIRTLKDSGVAINFEVKGYITKAQVLAELGQYSRLSEFCAQVLQKFDVRKEIGVPTSICTPASAYWNQRMLLSSSRQRIKKLSETVNGRQSGLTLSQWAQISAMTLEFKPDFIIELGRGGGDSTCMLTESANQLGGMASTLVTSLSSSVDFVTEVVPRLLKRNLVDRNWFLPLDCWQTNILTFNFESLMKDKKRVLVYWNTHGFEVAGLMLGLIMPQLVNKQHMVIMPGLSDKRYMSPESLKYNEKRLWRSSNSGGSRITLGNINSAVEQAVSITDFTSRNGFDLLSADHSNHTEIKPHPEKMKEMQQLLGDDFFQLQGGWFCFSLNNYPEPFTFPRFEAPEKYLEDEQIELLSKLSIR